jgi:hypothetical protein
MPHSREIDYYKRRVDELATQCLKYDYEISGLRHAIRQKERGFALLSALQQAIGGHKEISSVFEAAIGPITSILAMDRTIVLVPTEKENVYRPSLWVGVREPAADRLPSLAIEFPAEFAQGTGVLVVNSQTEPTPLIGQLARVQLRTSSASVTRSVYPADPVRSVDRDAPVPAVRPGDVDVQAITGLISASVENMRITVLQETDRCRTEFFANISHEFGRRSP